jgi:hypothetical protein
MSMARHMHRGAHVQAQQGVPSRQPHGTQRRGSAAPVLFFLGEEYFAIAAVRRAAV